MQTPLDHGPRQKIGILTFHRCINYGSYWQAKCLADGIRGMGHEVQILDHQSSAINLAEWRVALRPTLPTPVPAEDVKLYERKVRLFERSFCGLPLSEPFDIDEPEEMPEFDTIIVGSDEVWNLRHPWFAGKPAFFGQRLRAERIIAYAASFGNYSCWEGIGQPYTNMLKQLDAIAVRDENSWWMLNNELGISPPIVLDPTLQFPPATTEQEVEDDPFLLVYGHNFSSDFARAAREFAEKRNLPLVSFGYRNDWADRQWLDASPSDFARVFRHARGVVTNFFHGCAFSFLNNQPFACEATAYRSIKVRGLLELLGAQDRLLEDVQQLPNQLSQPSQDPIANRLTELRQIGSDYLTQALSTRQTTYA